MSRTRKFHIFRGTKLVGDFIVTNNKPTVKLVDNLDYWDPPIDFVVEYQEGQREFSGKIVDDFVKDRVVPSGRQNIREILQQVGIEEYDPLEMFIFYRGRTIRDSIHLEDIK